MNTAQAAGNVDDNVCKTYCLAVSC